MDTQFLTSLFSLEGKTAIMTGATGGLGSVMALALAKAGANIVSIEMPNDPNSNALHDLLMPTNQSITSVTCSLIDAKSLRGCWQQLWQEGVQADILVNIAGVIRRNKCEDATDEEIDEVCYLSKPNPVYQVSNHLYPTLRPWRLTNAQCTSQSKNSGGAASPSTALGK
jgi:2-deoxy-D-gluconate 3-dehydrogenase